MFKARHSVLLLSTLLLVVACSRQDQPVMPVDSRSDLVVLYRGEIDLELLAMDIVAEVEGPEGASSALLVHGRNVSYDDRAGILAVDLSVANASDRTLPLPPGITFLQFTGAEVAVQDPDNGRAGSGALIRFPSAGKSLTFADRFLAPGRESLPRRVHFRVAGGPAIGFVARIDMAADPDDGFVRVGDYFEARGEFRENPARLAAIRYEVHACDRDGIRAVGEADEDDGSDDFGCPQNFCYGRLNGPVTGLDEREGWIEVMGTPVHWRGKGGSHRGYDWWTRARVNVGMDDERNVVACQFPQKAQRWDEVRGYVQEVFRDDRGRITGVLVLNTRVAFPGSDDGGERPMGVVGGLVWNDRDGDGVKDADEDGLPGVPVTLSGDAAAATTTGPDGAYAFTMLAAGTYAVESTGPDGWSPTTDSPREVVLFADDSSFAGADFGWREDPVEPTGTIAGTVWNDLNGNGVREAGENGLAGVPVTLSGDASAATTTGPDGVYSFGMLAAGSYAVTGAGPAGWAATTPSPSPVTLAADDSAVTGIDFGWMAVASGGDGFISGVVFHDLNGNGTRDDGEPPLGGVLVHLAGPVGGTEVSSGMGVFTFLQLGAGSYTVTTDGPAGWAYTSGPANVMLATDFSMVVDVAQGWREEAAP